MWVLNILHTRKQANGQTKYYSRFKFSPSYLFPSSSSFFSPSSYPLPFYLAFFCLEFTLSLFPIALGFSITPNTEPSFCISLLCSSILFIRRLPSASVQLHSSPRFLPDALLWFRGSIQNTKDNNFLVFPWAGIQVFIFSFTTRLVCFFSSRYVIPSFWSLLRNLEKLTEVCRYFCSLTILHKECILLRCASQLLRLSFARVQLASLGEAQSHLVPIQISNFVYIGLWKLYS